MSLGRVEGDLAHGARALYLKLLGHRLLLGRGSWKGSIDAIHDNWMSLFSIQTRRDLGLSLARLKIKDNVLT